MNLEILQPIATAIAQERSVGTVLRKIVEGLANQTDVALARIWLIDRGDICSTCPFRSECPDKSRCLHLVASAGRAVSKREEDWSRIDGNFRRIPLGVRKIGQIAAAGEPILVRNIAADHQWIARPDWAKREKIVSFAGHPLVFRDEILGALAIFTRFSFEKKNLKCLRAFADYAAVAIANARAFEEISRLHERLEMENAYLREEVSEEFAHCDMVGRSAALQKLQLQIQMVAPTDATALIQGESGTGKEMVARSIHERSLRRNRPLIKINCASIPRELFESEFFGHIKGAFTGAMRDRAGRFQLADGGTLFLDEVGEIPLELQSKLLRALQEGEFERLGEERTRRVDVRVIAATNRDLKREVEAARFRQDLYYRLSVFPIEMPPLRERIEDVRLLAEHFLLLACRRLKCSAMRLTEQQVELLQSYDWPGNIRELQNVIERAAILSQGGPVRFDLVMSNTKPIARSSQRAVENQSEEKLILSSQELKRRERDNIILALELARWKVYGPGGAAELLGIKPTTLASRMKAMNIRKSA